MNTLWRPLRPANHDLAARAFDGVWLPRWLHHLSRALASVVVMLVWRACGVDAWLAGVAALVLLGVVPHVAGVALRRYAFDGPDWCADAWLAVAGIVVVAFLASWALGVVALGLYLAGYSRLYPWASP